MPIAAAFRSLGGASEQYGISLSGKPGATVRGNGEKLPVSRFRRGIRPRAASSNLIVDNTASDNGDRHPCRLRDHVSANRTTT